MKKIKDDKLVKKKKSKKNSSKKKKVIIILSLILTFIIVTVLLYILVFDKKVYLEGFEEKGKVLVKTEYVDKKFSICYGTIINCKPLKVEKVGDVDTSKLGEYTITYKYKTNKEESISKKVVVYDDVKPEIVIDSELSFCKNGKVGNGSYHATDNYDGDLTESVKLTIEGDKSFLEVSDSSGNRESIEVEALEFTSDPVITLNGDSTINLYVGDNYIEKGAVASDICDGDIRLI